MSSTNTPTITNETSITEPSHMAQSTSNAIVSQMALQEIQFQHF